MIRGMHAMYYSTEPEALRAFLKDKLGLTARLSGAESIHPGREAT